MEQFCLFYLCSLSEKFSIFHVVVTLSSSVSTAIQHQTLNLTAALHSPWVKSSVSAMEHKANEVCNTGRCNYIGVLVTSDTTPPLSLQCSTTTSPQKHMKNRSKSTEEMQQTKKVSCTLTFTPPAVSFPFSSHFIWLSCLAAQAFPSQKSLPGRPELDKVKVSHGHKNPQVAQKCGLLCLVRDYFCITVVCLCVSGVSRWLRHSHVLHRGTKVIMEGQKKHCWELITTYCMKTTHIKCTCLHRETYKM